MWATAYLKSVAGGLVRRLVVCGVLTILLWRDHFVLAVLLGLIPGVIILAIAATGAWMARNEE
jgi:hypothetical protein